MRPPSGVLVILFMLLPLAVFAAPESSAFAVKPWKTGQFVVYQIIGMEGEDAGNRYRISLTAEEEVKGKKYFWMTIDIRESVRRYGNDVIVRKDKKNVSFRALVPALDTQTFAKDAAAVISQGVFPRQALKLLVQFEEGPWYQVDPKDFFDHQEVIEDTPYALSPHARGRINYNKLSVDQEAKHITTPAGVFLCHHVSVPSRMFDEYQDEGFDLWRSASVPILGMVRMEFSKTEYWQKWEHKNQENINKPWWEIGKPFIKKWSPAAGEAMPALSF